MYYTIVSYDQWCWRRDENAERERLVQKCQQKIDESSRILEDLNRSLETLLAKKSDEEDILRTSVAEISQVQQKTQRLEAELSESKRFRTAKSCTSFSIALRSQSQ